MAQNGTDDGKITVWDGLSDRQIEAANYKLLNPNATYAEIEAELEIPENTIKRWGLNAIVADIRKDTGRSVQDYAERAAIDAIRLLHRQTDSKDERIAQSAAKELLDRAIGKPAQRQIVQGDVDKPVNVRVTYDDYNPKTS